MLVLIYSPGKKYCECRSLLRFALHRDGAQMGFNNCLYKGKPETASNDFAGLFCADAIKLIKKLAGDFL